MEYLKNITTLKINTQHCIGCGMCLNVCPHAVFTRKGKVVEIESLNRCMECGSCKRNCPVQVIEVVTGVGCAELLIRNKGEGKQDCGCS